MLLNSLTFHGPQNLAEALSIYSEHESIKIQAGGTFLLNALKLLKKKGAKTPEHVLSLQYVKELKGVEADQNQLTIKSMTTIDELAASAHLKDHFSVLRLVCKNISTQPIRNMATVGGNLTCRYTWTEMPAAMIGLQATLHFVGKNGEEENLSAEQFYLNQAKTDKILTHLTVPRNPNSLIAYQRVRKTQGVDIPLLSLMIHTTLKGNVLDRTIVSVNNCVQFAQRDKSLENYLNGKQLREVNPDQALDHMEKSIYDTRSDDYKKYMFRYCIKNALKDILNQAKQKR